MPVDASSLTTVKRCYLNQQLSDCSDNVDASPLIDNWQELFIDP